MSLRIDLAQYLEFIARTDPALYIECLDMFSDYMDEVEDSMQDAVNHPSHYQTPNGVECIDAIQAALTPEEFAGFLKGNALKYIWRAGKKGDPIQDFKKSAWYIDKLI